MSAPTQEEVYALYSDIFDNYEKMISSVGVGGEYLEYLKREKVLQERIDDIESRAKAAYGPKVVGIGRVYRVGVADGYASYLVYKVNKSSVKVLHLAMGDAWQDHAVSPSGSLPLRLAKQAISRTDAFAEFFGGGK